MGCSILSYEQFPFVLKYLCTWDSNFQELLDKGNHDNSDMLGIGYYITDEGKLFCECVYDYDSFEYFNEELCGPDRILKGVSNLMQDKIAITTFLEAYEYIKYEREQYLQTFTGKALKLAGMNDEDIARWEI